MTEEERKDAEVTMEIAKAFHKLTNENKCKAIDFVCDLAIKEGKYKPKKSVQQEAGRKEGSK